ncbi:MAG: DUF1153 domain-containing protein [Hyphomonadaceae bacterium]
MTAPGIRWTAAKKHELVASLVHGDRTRESVMADHPTLSEEELDSWIAAFKRGSGEPDALKQNRMLRERPRRQPA